MSPDLSHKTSSSWFQPLRVLSALSFPALPKLGLAVLIRENFRVRAWEIDTGTNLTLGESSALAQQVKDGLCHLYNSPHDNNDAIRLLAKVANLRLSCARHVTVAEYIGPGSTGWNEETRYMLESYLQGNTLRSAKRGVDCVCH